MLVTDRRRTRHRDLVRLVAEAVRGGVGIVQVREKDLPDDALRELVQRLRDALPEQTTMLVNGSYRVARTCGIGLHLPAAAELPWGGQPAPEGLLFGRSAHDEDEALRARAEQAAYAVLGTIFETPSKPGLRGQGVEFVRRVAERVAPLPVFAIGGVSVSRIPQLLHAGAHGVAVCGELLSANDPRRVAEAMTLALAVATG